MRARPASLRAAPITVAASPGEFADWEITRHRARQALTSSGAPQDPGASFDNCGHEQDDLVMAKTVNVIVTDDLDGSEGAKAVLFSFQGTSYEIDLSPGNEAKLAESLAP